MGLTSPVGARIAALMPCRWCYKSVCPEGHHRCLAAVAPEAVVEAVLRLLGGGPHEVWSEALGVPNG